jgi:hypothetical protein
MPPSAPVPTVGARRTIAPGRLLYPGRGARRCIEPQALEIDPVAEIEAENDAGKLRQQRIERYHAAAFPGLS